MTVLLLASRAVTVKLKLVPAAGVAGTPVIEKCVTTGVATPVMKMKKLVPLMELLTVSTAISD